MSDIEGEIPIFVSWFSVGFLVLAHVSIWMLLLAAFLVLGVLSIDGLSVGWILALCFWVVAIVFVMAIFAIGLCMWVKPWLASWHRIPLSQLDTYLQCLASDQPEVYAVCYRCDRSRTHPHKVPIRYGACIKQPAIHTIHPRAPMFSVVTSGQDLVIRDSRMARRCHNKSERTATTICKSLLPSAASSSHIYEVNEQQQTIWSYHYIEASNKKTLKWMLVYHDDDWLAWFATHWLTMTIVIVTPFFSILLLYWTVCHELASVRDVKWMTSLSPSQFHTLSQHQVPTRPKTKHFAHLPPQFADLDIVCKT